MRGPGLVARSPRFPAPARPTAPASPANLPPLAPHNAGHFSVGDVVLFITYMGQLFGPLNWLGGFYSSIQVRSGGGGGQIVTSRRRPPHHV